jgi:hypothetical protein
MKVGIPPVGSVSPCVRMFVESLIREVEDASIPWVFEPEGADLNPSAIAAVEEIRVANRERSSQPTA